MYRLLLAFIAIPTIELVLLIEIGQRIGTLPTLLLIVATGALGAWLVRRQGLDVLRTVRAETAAGRLPAGALVDGIVILLAGAVLLTPGILTDVVGFACLVPGFRGVIKRRLKGRFERVVLRGSSHFTMDFSGPSASTRSGPIKDVTPSSLEVEAEHGREGTPRP